VELRLRIHGTLPPLTVQRQAVHHRVSTGVRIVVSHWNMTSPGSDRREETGVGPALSVIRLFLGGSDRCRGIAVLGRRDLAGLHSTSIAW